MSYSEIDTNKTFLTCKHRWTVINKIHVDRLNWLTAQRCRRCGKKEQSRYKIDMNNNMNVSCVTSPIADDLSI